MITDRQNRLWIGAENGLQIIDPAIQNFSSYPLYRYNNLDNPGDFGLVIKITETNGMPDMAVWFVQGRWQLKANGKLEKINTAALFPPSPDNYSLRINAFMRDQRGNTWYATDSGLVRSGAAGVKHFELMGVPVNSEINQVINDVKYWKNEIFVLRLRHAGIVFFDAQKERVIREFRLGENGLDSTVIQSIYVDRDSVLWVGSSRQLQKYEEGQNRFISVQVDL